MTCAHVDIAPQLECAHGLHGVNLEVEDRHLTSRFASTSVPSSKFAGVTAHTRGDAAAAQRAWGRASGRREGRRGEGRSGAGGGGGGGAGQQQQQQQQEQQVQEEDARWGGKYEMWEVGDDETRRNRAWR
jgi:hypothetical protein